MNQWRFYVMAIIELGSYSVNQLSITLKTLQKLAQEVYNKDLLKTIMIKHKLNP